DRDLVGAERLDRLDRHLAPVELDAGLRLHRLGDVGRGDGAEQPAPLAGPSLDLDPLGRQLAGGGLRPLLLPPVADLAGTAHRLRLALDARARHHGQPLRHQVVPGVAGRHLHQVALVAEVVDVGPQHDLHVRTTPWGLEGLVAEVVVGRGLGGRCGAAVAAPTPTSSLVSAAAALGLLDLGRGPAQARCHLVGDDLDGAALQRLAHVLRQLPPADDVEEAGRLLPFAAVAVLPAAVDGDAEAGVGLAARREPQLGVAGDVAHDGDAVAGHLLPSFLRFRRGWRGPGRPSLQGFLGNADHLVAEDFVGKGEHPVQLLFDLHPRRELHEDVVALPAVAELVGEATLAPAVDATGGSTPAADELRVAVDRRPDRLLLQAGIEDEHDLVRPHGPCTSCGPQVGLRAPLAGEQDG